MLMISTIQYNRIALRGIALGGREKTKENLKFPF